MSKIDPVFSVRLLLQACLGVLIGSCVALLLARLFFPIGGHLTAMPEGLLSWNLHNVLFKPREKGFYILSIALGGLAAYWSTSQKYDISFSRLLVGVLASILLINYLALGVLHTNNIILIVFLIGLVSSIFYIYIKTNHHVYRSVVMSVQSYQFQWIPYLVLVLIASMLLIPESVEAVAARISMTIEREVHIVSFMAGPALYFFGDHLLPGIDYFTQYSFGMGWLFSYIIGKTPEQALINYVWLVLAAIWIFYAQVTALLIWLYRSWVVAGIVSLLSLVLLFHTKDHFFDPSSSVLRYPFLGVCAYFLSVWVRRPTSLLRQIALGFVIGSSIFFNTETGIISGFSVALAYFFTNRSKEFLSLISVGMMGLGFFLLWLVSVFGWHVLQPSFFVAMIEPLVIYGKIGFGGWPVNWSMTDLNWFYNIVAPGMAIATLALIARQASSHEPIEKDRMAVLAFFALCGLLMLVKYVNMSIIAVWQMNALGFLIVLGWWGQVVYHRLYVLNIRWAKAVSVVFMLGIFWIGAMTQDSRNPSEYGLHSWIYYPSFAKALIRPSNISNPSIVLSNQVTKSDVMLIQQRTKSMEQTAIIDLYDWAYLISAHRPPLMQFLPSELIFTDHQLKTSLERLSKSKYLFLPKSVTGEPVINQPDIRDRLLPTFHQFYIKDGESDHLIAWRHRDIQEAPLWY